jgi:hypothetical protein
MSFHSNNIHKIGDAWENVPKCGRYTRKQRGGGGKGNFEFITRLKGTTFGIHHIIA